jgi:hypothetical protein
MNNVFGYTKEYPSIALFRQLDVPFRQLDMRSTQADREVSESQYSTTLAWILIEEAPQFVCFDYGLPQSQVKV